MLRFCEGRSFFVTASEFGLRHSSITRHQGSYRYDGALPVNFFANLKPYRGMATRYDKRARNFLGAIYLAAFVN
jgi:hypothetical protein